MDQKMWSPRWRARCSHNWPQLVVARHIVTFFEQDPIGIDSLLEELSIQDFVVSEDSHLDNLKIVITGSFENFSRDELKQLIKQRGGIPSSAVSSKTDFLIIGENAGSKLKKATEFGIELITEDKLDDFLKL